ncbi:MAG: RNA polymerase sigma factor [Vulcanimicrobiaceae bacterium]
MDEAYRAYGTALFSTARYVLGNDDDAADCVHDALLRVWLRPTTYRLERGPLRAYLIVCVRNEAISRRRTAARHARIEEGLARTQAESYEFEIGDHVEAARLRAGLAALPDEQRTALELAYFNQLSHTQIADRLGVPLGTIKSRLSLALRKLQIAFGDQTQAHT